MPDTGSPWRIYLAADYTRPVGANDEFYARMDWTYGSQPKLTGSVNPTDPGYNPLNIAAPSYSLVSARIGYRMGIINASVFAENLFNDRRRQGVTNQNNSPYYTTSYLRPRTFGLQVATEF